MHLVAFRVSGDIPAHGPDEQCLIIGRSDSESGQEITRSVPDEAAIQEIVDRETRAWDTKDVPLLLSVFHPDMVWAWPPHAMAHDPVEWRLSIGRFDAQRRARSTRICSGLGR